MQEIHLHSLWEKIVKKEKIKIAIDGSSYAHDDEDLNVLSTLNIYEQFEVLYISCKKIKDKNFYFKFFTPEYKEENEILIECVDSKELRISGFRNKEVKDVFSIELIAAITFADVVVTRIEIYPILKKHSLEYVFNGKKTFIGSLSRCLSAIRAWVNNQNKLSTSTGSTHHFSKWRSIIDAQKKLLPNFQTAWRATVSTQENKFLLGEGTIQDYLSSISLRAMHLITTRDLLEVLKLNSFDRLFNPKADNFSYKVIYHFGYYLLLITAVVDSLEWITSWRIYNKVKYKSKVSFRNTKECHKSFVKDLVKFNENLSIYVNSDSIQSTLKLVYSIRNFFAHSILPGFASYSGCEGLSGDLIALKGNLETEIKKFIECNNLNKRQLLEVGIEIKRPILDPRHNDIVIEPILFSRYVLMRVMEFIDTVFKYLYIEKKLITIQNEQDKFDSLGKISLRTNRYDFFEKMNQALVAIEASVP